MQTNSFFAKLGRFFARVGKFFGNLWQDIVGGGKVIFSNGKTACGFIVVLVFVLVAIFGSMIIPYNPDTDGVN